MRKIFCTCCKDEIRRDHNEDIWYTGKEIFCTQDCCVIWFAEQIREDSIEDEYQDLLNQYGVETKEEQT